MRNVLKILGLSILNAGIIIIMLVSIIRLKLTMPENYTAYGVTAVLFPLLLLLLYKRFFGRETLFVVPVSLILSAAYSLGVSLYSYYGTGSFSGMFNQLLYFIYFLPSIIYCGTGWIFFAVILRITREPRRSS